MLARQGCHEVGHLDDAIEGWVARPEDLKAEELDSVDGDLVETLAESAKLRGLRGAKSDVDMLAEAGRPDGKRRTEGELRQWPVALAVVQGKADSPEHSGKASHQVEMRAVGGTTDLSKG